jgi:hypothetical protein
MKRETLKIHLLHIAGFVFVFAIVLVFVILSVITFLAGLEQLWIGIVFYFFIACIMSFICAFNAAIFGRELHSSINDYLNSRTIKVPEVCPECKADLHPADVKWVEEWNKAECPHCGIEVKVTKVWE